MTHFENQEIKATLIIAVLAVVTVLAIYEFVVYKAVLKRSLYNKAFNISIAVIPYFVATIIMCLQSNLVITLGTIGALAIIRFRTAVKDPVDMIFILWAIHIGITCGCQLYGLSVITSVAVTVVLIILNMVSFGTKTHVLVIHYKEPEGSEKVEEIIHGLAKRVRIKSRNFTNKGIHFVYELQTAKAKELTKSLAAEAAIERFSLMEYDPDDII